MAYSNKEMIESNIRWRNLGLDLYFIIVYIVITIATIYLPVVNETIVRSALGLGLVLFVPGYALLTALFPDNKRIDRNERIALSLGLSVVVSVLAGMMLNFVPGGITLGSAVISLSVLSIIFMAIAVLRRNHIKPENRFEIDAADAYKRLKSGLLSPPTGRVDTLLTFILILAIIGSVAMVAALIMMPRQGESFTEFYLLGADGRAGNYPTALTVGETGTVIVGVANHENREVPYDLLIRMNDSGNISGVLSEKLLLQDNQTWERKVSLTPDHPGNSIQAEFLLYADGNMTAPYRDLHLWLDVAPPREIPSPASDDIPQLTEGSVEG